MSTATNWPAHDAKENPVADRRHPSASGVSASSSLARSRRRGATRPDRTSFRWAAQRIGRVFAVLVVVVEQAVQLVEDLAQQPADVDLAHPHLASDVLLGAVFHEAQMHDPPLPR